MAITRYSYMVELDSFALNRMTNALSNAATTVKPELCSPYVHSH